MLYASTRSSLFRAFSSTVFTDSIFATSKEDLTPDSYAAHRRHNAAPKPLSSREQELADIRAAESDSISYQGTRARTSHIDTSVGFRWSEEAETAIVNLGRGDGCAVVVIQVDPEIETLTLTCSKDISIEHLPEALPTVDPCYVFFAWPHSLTTPPRREIIFIYSCPSTSRVKHRMLYSSGSLSTFRAGKGIILASSPMAYIASRKIETSDPKELDGAHLKAMLGLEEVVDIAGNAREDDRKSFARPKGPTRKH
ncbi:hypothetical protein AX17_003356 [Amanita inopinata Kibby_2008]|nr:hypothetical protein AX17_003356 [Amanita inopinata Kibby_2008]